jgi:hypothetical protein
MKLPFFKNRPSTTPREYLFALEIGRETVKSAIWSVVNNKTQVLAIGTPVPWDGVSAEQLVAAGDKTLSAATTNLDQTGKTQPQKLVLGLPTDWVSADKINPDHLKVLRDLTQKLSLSAIGFVVTSQALVRHLQHVEGVPPTAILIGFGERFLEVTLVRLGKIAATHLVTRSASIPADIIEGLYRFGQVDMLPSRILIYNSTTDLESVRQQLLSYPWQAPQTKLPFLHFPKIEVLPPDFSIKAISLSGGSEVAEAIGLIPPPSPTAPVEPLTVSSDVSAPDLGFYPEVDIATTPVATPPPEPLPSPPQRFSRPRISLPRFRLPRFRLPRLPLRPLVAAILFLIIVGLAAAYWYLPQATVTLFVSAKSLQQQLDIFADSYAGEVDLAAKILPIKTLEVTVSGTLTKNSSGSKLVGDKATGEVTVINGTSSPHTFPAGTVITANNLQFTLDSAVSVASASGTADPNSYQPGKANVKVTAGSIGSDSNLSAGSQFKIGSFSSLDFIAKNDVAFSAGSSRQVAAVAKSDLSDLKSQLVEQLKSQITDQLSGDQLTEGASLIAGSIQYQTLSEKFDHAEGDMTDQVKLDLSFKGTALAYNNSQLDQLVLSGISSQVPAGYELDGQPQTQLSLGAAKDKLTAISVGVSAALLPQVDTQQVAKSITGKSPLQAKNQLAALPNITEVNISFSPKLPGFLLSLPHLTQNIRVLVQSK